MDHDPLLPPLPRRAALALIAAFGADFAIDARAGLFDTGLAGSGRLVDESRAITGFKSITLSGPIKLVLVQSGHEAVALRGDDNLLPVVETVLEGQTLRIGVKHGVSIRNGDITATVDLIALHALSIGGSGEVRCDKLVGPRLEVAQGGSARVRLDGLDLNAFNASVGGSGGLQASGRANRFSLSVGGSGDVQADSLKAEEVVVSAGGSGNARVHAERNLRAAIAGSGSVVYSGNPQVSQSIAGSGTLRKR